MKKIKLNKKSWTILAVVLFSTSLFLFSGKMVLAGTEWVTWLVGGLAQGIASILGWILVKLMAVLIQVAQYNNFIRSAAIVNGWVIARDIANMFFVVILLIIAFATILRIENYSYKKWLPKLILMAVLINFSKTICGLLIDLSQVVMLTFVNAFKDVAAAGLVDMLGITGWQSLDGIEEVDGWTVASAYVLSVIYLVITLITVTAMVGMLVMRIVMIWVYVVLSPFAYLLAAFPGGAKYSSQWWSEFTKNLIVGPVLAFFIWLSFTSLVSFNDDGNDVTKDFQDTSGAADITCQTGADGECKYGTSDLMIKFIIAIAMLLGGMKIAQEIGGAAAGVAGSIASKGNKLAIGAAAGAGLAVWKSAKGKAADFRDSASLASGVDLNVVAAWKRRNTQQDHDRQQKKNLIRESTLANSQDDNISGFKRKMALLSTGDVAYRNIKELKFGGSAKKRAGLADEMKQEKTNQKQIDADIVILEADKAKIITKDEENVGINKMATIDNEVSDLNDEADIIRNDKAFTDLEKAETGGYINSKQQVDLDSRRAQIKTREDKATQLLDSKQKIEELHSSAEVVADDDEKKLKVDAIDQVIAYRQGDKSVSVDRQKVAAASYHGSKVKYVGSALAEVQSGLEREAEKGISGKTNSDELANIFNEAVSDHDFGLMSAIAKKMAKLGNYNDLLRSQGLGTGLNGMHGLADIMKDKGGMSDQASLGVIAELGEIVKSGKHYQGFGTVHMNETGNWEKSSYEDQQKAIFSEQSKIQTQAFSRDANRLGIGHYEGEQHDAAHWVLDDATIALFASKDDSYAKQIGDTGNINLISFVASNPKNLELLEKNGAKLVAAEIRKVASKIQGGNASNPADAINKIIH